MSDIEAMAENRYQVVRTAFWWRVKIGDGQQTVGRCNTQTEAERLGAALRTAFLDGAFAAAQGCGTRMRQMSVSYPSDSRPHIQMRHIDGPVLWMRDGRLHWLTWPERIAVRFGWHDAYSLERKYWAQGATHE